jgi:zinc protease
MSLPDSTTVHRTQLDNGITILIYPTPHTRSVAISGSLHAGAIYEDQATHGGLASLIAAALMRGTTTRDFDTIYSELEDIGADLSFYGGMHKIGFNGKALAEDLPVLLDLLADALRHPTFPAEPVERLRGERLTSLNYLRQDTQWRSSVAFRRTLYPSDHPYHYSTRGTLETLPRIILGQMHAFHGRHYGPRGMIISIAGAVDPDRATARITEALGDWANPDQPPIAALPPVEATADERRDIAHVPGKSQVDVLMGTLGPSRLSPDYQAANLGNSILGVFGMMGRIGDRVREREGLAYYAGSRVDGGYGPGAWRISAGVDPDDLDRVIALCKDEIRRFITEPVSQQDLEDNQSYFVGRLPLQLESNDGLAATLHSIESYDLGLDYLTNYSEMIEAITAEDILRAAQTYLDPDRLVLGIAGTL